MIGNNEIECAITVKICGEVIHLGRSKTPSMFQIWSSFLQSYHCLWVLMYAKRIIHYYSLLGRFNELESEGKCYTESNHFGNLTLLVIQSFSNFFFHE